MTTRRWKGLDTTRMPVFIGYDQAERMIGALLDEAARWRPEAVVGISRGGLVPATMAASLLALPLHMITCDALTGMASWIGSPPEGRRILLVDDCCGTGQTMNAARLALHDQGWTVLTLTVTHDPETTCYVPDLSHPMRELFRFPWERGEATPDARALRATGARSDRRMEAPFVGFDLDCISTAVLAPDRAVVITGRPESERADAMARLARHGHAGLPLECRPAELPDDALSMARYKAETATRWGCTHFIESDAELAIRIAAVAPHLVVSWHSAPEARAWLIGAAAQPGG